MARKYNIEKQFAVVLLADAGLKTFNCTLAGIKYGRVYKHISAPLTAVGIGAVLSFAKEFCKKHQDQRLVLVYDTYTSNTDFFYKVGMTFNGFQIEHFNITKMLPPWLRNVSKNVLYAAYKGKDVENGTFRKTKDRVIFELFQYIDSRGPRDWILANNIDAACNVVRDVYNGNANINYAFIREELELALKAYHISAGDK